MGKRSLRRRTVRSGYGLAAGLAICVSFLGGQWSAAREPLPRLTPLLAAGETIVGEKILYPSGAPAKVTATILALQPGDETGWHTHGVPAFGYILDGELTVDYGEKGKRVYKPGDAVMEAINVLHNGRNTGDGIMRILAVFMGAEGLPLSVPASVKVEKAPGPAGQTP